MPEIHHGGTISIDVAEWKWDERKRGQELTSSAGHVLVDWRFDDHVDWRRRVSAKKKLLGRHNLVA
jgi:hypothetical protein